MLFRLAEDAHFANSLGLHNDAIHGENFFCRLLSLVYGWNLENANIQKLNQKGFDIEDASLGLYIQITTSQSHKAKHDKVFKYLNDPKNIGKHRDFLLLYVTRKVEPAFLASQTINGIAYKGVDLEALATDLFKLKKSALELQPIYDLLYAETSTLQPLTINKIQKPAQQIPQLRTKDFYIDRSSMIAELFNFTQLANGLITGGPGFGKSFTIEELQRYYGNCKIPCFVIKINELINCSSDEIASELGTISNWIDALLTIPFSTEKKSLLIFDAFDTAKEETAKKAVLKHIKTAKDKLAVHWNICVSTRTFDAEKSQRLIELFPAAGKSINIGCRHFEIPELSDIEIAKILTKRKRLRTAYNTSDKALRQLIKTPYFLRLLESIVAQSIHPRISDISTEEQLLSAFWEKRANSHEKQVLLNKLTNQLSKNESLSVNKFNIVLGSEGTAYEELLSDGVLTETSFTRQNISFSHNILLEYAIFKYVLPDDADNAIAFLKDYEKLPFLFRNSFIYYYSCLWNQDRALYWKHYFSIGDISQPIFRLVHQTILNFVLITQYKNLNDFKPVIITEDLDKRAKIIRKILEGTRFIRTDKLTSQDIDLLVSISEDLHPVTLWDTGNLISRAVTECKSNKTELKKLAIASANLFSYVLRAPSNLAIKQQIQANGFIWAIPSYLLTYKYQKDHKTSINSLIELLNEDEFPIMAFHALADHIDEIAKRDIVFTLSVYQRIYSHYEKNARQAAFGGGVVMPLSMSRTQMFEAVHHELERKFADLLRINANRVISFGLELAENAIIDKSTQWSHKSSHHVLILGAKGKITDVQYSSFDYDTDKDYGPLSHLKNTIAYFHELSESGNYKQVVDHTLTYIRNAKSMISWSRLLRFLTKWPEPYKDLIGAILSNTGIYRTEATRYQSGELIKACWLFLSASERLKIEETVAKIPRDKYQSRESQRHYQAMLLSCIPSESDLQHASIKLLAEEGKVTNQRPRGLTMASIKTITAEEEMRRLGLHASVPKELSAFNLIKNLEEFNDGWLISNTKGPVKPSIEMYWDTFIQLEDIEINNLPETAAEARDIELCRFCQAGTKKEHHLSEIRIKLLEAYVMRYVHITEETRQDENSNLKRRFFTGSSSVKTYATGALVNLLWRTDSPAVADAIALLIDDAELHVRLYVAQNLNWFWGHRKSDYWMLILPRLANEVDGMILHQLLLEIKHPRIVVDDQSIVESACEVVDLRFFSEETSDELNEAYVVLLLNLLLLTGSEKSKALIYKNFTRKDFRRQLIIHSFRVIDPHNNDHSKERQGSIVTLLAVLNDLIDSVFNLMASKSSNDNSILDELESIDLCIQQIYFSITTGRGSNKDVVIKNTARIAYYRQIKPTLRLVIDRSKEYRNGFMMGHTGYYFMQLLNYVLSFDPEGVLQMAVEMVDCATAGNYTSDHITLRETIKFVESILADHKSVLRKKENFNGLIAILDQFAASGWIEPLNLIWKLKDVF